MRVLSASILFVAALLAVSTAPAAAGGSQSDGRAPFLLRDRLPDPRAPEATVPPIREIAIADRRYAATVRALTGCLAPIGLSRLDHRGRIVPGASLADDLTYGLGGVPLDAEIIDGRYYAGASCEPHGCGTRVLHLYDIERDAYAFALYHAWNFWRYPEAGIPPAPVPIPRTLTIFLPEPASDTFQQFVLTYAQAWGEAKNRASRSLSPPPPLLTSVYGFRCHGARR
eukprot:g474.t1